MSQLFIVSPIPRSAATASVAATYSSNGSHAHSAISRRGTKKYHHQRTGQDWRRTKQRDLDRRDRTNFHP